MSALAHKQSNIEGSQFRKAMGQKYNLGREAEISIYRMWSTSEKSPNISVRHMR
jgi:hypothetical protein